MKIFTSKTQPFYSKEFGWLEQITFMIFGLKFWTEIHMKEVDAPRPPVHERVDIAEISGYEKWREEMHLMRLSDEEFDLLINQR